MVSTIINDKVTNSVSSEISTLTISDKIPPITITSHSKDQTAIINQATNLPTFSVNASTGVNNQQLKYQWYQSETNSTTGGALIIGAKSSSYTIASSNTQSEGKTYFYVKVSGTLNGLTLDEVTSEPMILTVTQAPAIVITTEPQNQNSIVNQTEALPTFSVIATTKNPDEELTYQWYSTTTNSNTNGVMIDGATNSSYTITAEDSKTAGTSKYFYVKISGTINGVALTPVTSSPASLTVKALPTIVITTQPTAQTVHANQNADFPSFSVVVTPIDNAELTYQWYSNTTNSTENATAIEGATNATYTTSQSDIGTPESKKYFYVQVSGSVGGIKLSPVNSDLVSLTTQAASTITISSQPTPQQMVAKNTNITLSATATSTGAKPLTYQWQKSDKNTDDAVWMNVANANSASYSFIENNEYSTVTYYRVIVGQESTSATQTSSLAKVTVGYTHQQAIDQMRIWLSKTTNQESLLNSFFTRSPNGPLGIFNLSSIYGYKFETLPKSNKYTLNFVKKTEANGLPFDAWSVRAVISEAGSISKWNDSTNRYENPESIPANSAISFYLPYNFRKEETVTVGSSSITISPTLSITNNSSQLLIMRDNPSVHIPYGFSANPLFKVSISRFLIGQTNPLLIQSSYQWPVLPTFTNSNSNLPAYMIVS